MLCIKEITNRYPTVLAQELYSMLGGDLNGKAIRKEAIIKSRFPLHWVKSHSLLRISDHSLEFTSSNHFSSPLCWLSSSHIDLLLACFCTSNAPSHNWLFLILWVSASITFFPNHHFKSSNFFLKTFLLDCSCFTMLC